MRKLTRNILDDNYTEDDVSLFKEFAVIIDNNYKDNEAHRSIWEYDKKIGGCGGYAAPLNPTVNPFNRLGDYRNVFRSLQYARCDMFICCRPRNIITDSALHVETLVKLLLSTNFIYKYISNKRELGKNIQDLYIRNIISKTMFERLDNYRKILNLAKHDTDPNEENTFDYEDAVVFYFETRNIGNELLKLLKHPSLHKEYDIDESW